MIIFVILAAVVAASEGLQKDDNFDFLMFTQLWPVTSCFQWEDRAAENTCSIGGSQNHWTIHGIWPTRDYDMGPFNCNRSAHFDPSALEPLMPELVDKWTDVRNSKDKYDFWRHEWEKHGTCAMQLESMNTEVKYFQKALELHKKYNIFQLLKSAGISPGQTYHPVEVWRKLKEELRGQDGLILNPAINCARDHSDPDPMFYEVIVCLDKKFNRISCDRTKGGAYGTCPRKQEDTINYPNFPSKRNVAPYVVLVFFLIPTLAILAFYLRKYWLRRSEYGRFVKVP